MLLGERPRVLDAEGLRTLVAPALAAFFWAGAVFREGVIGQPLDPLALLLRLLALALTVRTLLLGRVLVGRLLVSARRREYALALADEGLLLRTPASDFAVAREDIIDVVEHGQWGERSGRRWADVYVVTRPQAGRLHLAIPPVLGGTPGMLAERLMRWRARAPQPDAQPTRRDAEPEALASKLWEDLAAGARPPDVAVVPHGAGWLRRGPYATILLGVVVLEGFLRLPPETRAALGALGPLVIALCLAVVPATWFVLTRRELAAQRGISLAFTPAELLTRTRAGVQRVRWSQVTRLEVTSRHVWSILHGAQRARTLLVHRKEEDALAFSEAFLGVPAEVALALGDAYRKGTRASHASD